MSNHLSQPIKWYGGKAYQASHIISLMPSHQFYREPFFGGGAVLFRKEHIGIGEAVSDTHLELTDFWRCLADPIQSQEFIRIVNMIPLSEFEWQSSLDNISINNDRITKAVSFFVRYRQSRQGLGRDFATPTRRLRRQMAENVSAWLSAVDGLSEAHERLSQIEIRNLSFEKFIPKYDNENAFFYCDPPYLHNDIDDTKIRTVHDAYSYEMIIDQHIELLKILSNIKGKFLLSGYPSKLYDEWAIQYKWRHVDLLIDNKSSGSKIKEMKIERSWMNY